jgi:hypothetical protein
VQISLGGALIAPEEIGELLIITIAVALSLQRSVALKHVSEVTLVGALALVALTQLVSGQLQISSEAIFQARSFLPFATATAVLFAPLRLERATVVRAVFVSAALSALLALTIHLNFRDQLPRFAGDNHQTQIAMDSGRMYWNRGLAAILAPLALCVAGRKLMAVYVIGMLILLVASVLTQGRTALFAFFVSAAICIAISSASRIHAIVTLVVLSIAASIGAKAIMREADLQLLVQRLGLDGAESEIERAITHGRMPAYEQYLDGVWASPICGSGLGVPLSVTPSGEQIFTSDVSIIHVLIPFGLFGAAALCCFVWACWRRSRPRGLLDPCSRATGWLILVSVGISLNHDPFLRNMFVVALAFVVASQAPKRQQCGDGP